MIMRDYCLASVASRRRTVANRSHCNAPPPDMNKDEYYESAAQHEVFACLLLSQ